MKVKINKIFSNENNPRIIKDYKFKQLVKSIKEFPEMLEKRPIVVDEDMIVLGGNMRLKACREAGLKEVHIEIAEGWSDVQKEQFIIKDNVGFGEWDWDILANDWQPEELKEWGLDVWQPEEDVNFDDFFENTISDVKNEKNKILLEYSDDDFEKIKKIFNSLKGSKESIVLNALMK